MDIAPTPPAQSNYAWDAVFAAEMMRREPRLSLQGAHRSARLAYPCTWLLEPEEAAELWTLALNAALEARPAPQVGRPDSA